MKKAIWITSIFILIVSVTVVRGCGPGGNGVLSRLSLPDGSEYLLTQEWNDWVEPYTVEFWYRPNGGEWGWCYVDHQTLRWRNGSLRYDDKKQSVQVLRGGTLEAELFIKRKFFALYGHLDRELDAPQELRSPPVLALDS